MRTDEEKMVYNVNISKNLWNDWVEMANPTVEKDEEWQENDSFGEKFFAF